jgi:hypothetical protein
MLIIVTLKVSMDIPYKFLNLHNKSSLDSYKKGKYGNWSGRRGTTQHLKGSSLWIKDQRFLIEISFFTCYFFFNSSTYFSPVLNERVFFINFKFFPPLLYFPCTSVAPFLLFNNYILVIERNLSFSNSHSF